MLTFAKIIGFMKNNLPIIICYSGIFTTMLLTLYLLPKLGGYIWQPELINPLCVLLVTLLVFLIARIAHTNGRISSILGTAVFILLFCPGSSKFFLRDEEAVLELFSICIVPFFISQYTRISTKNFKWGYFLMLLMGIFCSYTHDGITIPLCLSFLLLSYIQRQQFFRLACWPMVIGFVIGTTLALLNSTHFSLSEISDFEILSTQTADGLSQLWDTKVFFFATWLTAYYTLSKNRRRRIFRIIRQQKLLSYCLLFSVCTIPFAPLGMDYAIEGVCFFCMFWVLFLFQDLVRHIRYKRHRFLSSRRTQRDSHIF